MFLESRFRETIRFICPAVLAMSFLSLNAHGQTNGERSVNSGIWSTPSARIPLPRPARAVVQIPERTEASDSAAPSAAGTSIETFLPGEAFLNVSATARASVIGDSTRLNGSSGAAFLPSAIPVTGDPFFGSDSRAFVQGAGNSVGLTGTVFTDNSDVFQVDSKFVVQNLNFGVSDTEMTGANTNIAIQQAYGRYNGLLVGLTDTAISNVDALPEILDVAGPNARVTVLQNGVGDGEGRLSYFALRPEAAGLAVNLSIENPVPEINRPSGIAPGSTFDTLAQFPDLLIAARYGDGNWADSRYYEAWHLQFGSVVRSLSLENDNGTFSQSELGWGVTMSGSVRFFANPDLTQRDAVFGSIIYGRGISHYIVDLRAQGADSNNNDAAINASGNLIALPALAWYTAFQHNWTDNLRSTATYSQVMLQSINTPTQSESPYHLGQYVQANFVYHNQFRLANEQSNDAMHSFFTGLECIYGQKETLDNSQGHASRLMWVVAFSN
jgi:hypothetical protein